jgi:hypothetical protein
LFLVRSLYLFFGTRSNMFLLWLRILCLQRLYKNISFVTL